MDFINVQLESATDVGAVIEDDENDFFFSKKRTSASELQLFLESNNDELTAYARWPKLRQLFTKLNTPVPASAACERLFSCAELIFRPHHCSMTDRNFENSLLVKLNNGFV